MSKQLIYFLLFLLTGPLFISCSNSTEIFIPEFKIKTPLSNQVFTNPQFIKIRWKMSGNYSKFKLYYSKFNVNRSGNWIQINESIDGALTEFTWENPCLYSNEVKLKLVGTHNGQEKVVYSDNVFAVHCDSLLSAERKFKRKLMIGNLWVYKFTYSELVGDQRIWYTKNKIIDSKIENDITYYKEIIKTYRDTVSFSTHWIASRDSYTPAVIMSNGDSWISTDSSEGYYSMKCSEYSEEIFGKNKKIKKYEWVNSGSGISSGDSVFAIDFGKISSFTLMEGTSIKEELMGAFIEGIVYGDTTIIN